MGAFEIFWGIFIFVFVIFELWFYFFSNLSVRNKAKKDSDENSA